MALARLRRFAWMLVLVLSAGLTAPAFASAFEVSASTTHLAAHVHRDGSAHANHGASPHERALAASAGKQAKSAAHCPGCLTAADCAMSCFGVGVLPASVVVPSRLVPNTWSPVHLAEPVGVSPFADLDPPRPVSVR